MPSPFPVALKRCRLPSILRGSAIEHKADKNFVECSSASVIAKVERDKHISNIPEAKKYRFDKNKGYGTMEHIELIKKHGISDIHRKSFKPIRILCD